ncbi:MAG: hypothetical protein DMD55_19695 [Gemmatimonadetes bacterium]|nr:MAG: hypothetical protein DMD55_19695 [Gemmatimonadota bacterium]
MGDLERLHRLRPGRIGAAVRCFVGYDALDEPQIVQEQGVRGVLREPLLHGLRVASRRLAGQVAVQQEVEALVLEVHTLITGQAGPDPQTDLSYSSQAIRRQRSGQLPDAKLQAVARRQPPGIRTS